MEEQDPSRLLRGDEQMLHRLRVMMDQPDHLTRPRFEDALEAARRQSVEQGELSDDEADRIANYLRRDLLQAAQYTADEARDLKGWLRMDLQLIEDWLLDQFTKATDLTRIELLNFQQGMLPPEVFHSEEVAGPGALICSDCGEMVLLEQVGIIPTCPSCGGHEFYRPMAEDSLTPGIENRPPG